MRAIYSENPKPLLELFSLHEKSLRRAESYVIAAEHRLNRLVFVAKNMKQIGVDTSEVEATIELMQSWADSAYANLIKTQESMVQDHINLLGFLNEHGSFRS